MEGTMHMHPLDYWFIRDCTQLCIGEVSATWVNLSHYASVTTKKAPTR